MGLIACPVPGKGKSKMLCEAFIAGAPKDAKGFVFYGVKAGNAAEWKRAWASRQSVYVIDNAYTDQTRGTHFRVTRSRFQHSGTGETDGARFAALGIELAPWRDWNLAGTLLVVHQSEDHMRYFARKPDWIERALMLPAPNTPEIRSVRSIGEVVHRHWTANKPEAQRTLAADLAHARMLVTHTSAAAVMATLAGVPSLTAPASAAFGMLYSPDRLRWAGVLADNQFTLDELKDGTAWQKVNPGSRSVLPTGIEPSINS